MAAEAGRTDPSGPPTVDPALVRELLEQLERAQNEIEKLVNRTNTLVHLLDILNKRIERLEAKG